MDGPGRRIVAYADIRSESWWVRARSRPTAAARRVDAGDGRPNLGRAGQTRQRRRRLHRLRRDRRLQVPRDRDPARACTSCASVWTIARVSCPPPRAWSTENLSSKPRSRAWRCGRMDPREPETVECGAIVRWNSCWAAVRTKAILAVDSATIGDIMHGASIQSIERVPCSRLREHVSGRRPTWPRRRGHARSFCLG